MGVTRSCRMRGCGTSGMVHSCSEVGPNEVDSTKFAMFYHRLRITVTEIRGNHEGV